MNILTVNRRTGRLFLSALAMASVFGLAACHTTVPEPTMPVKNAQKAFPEYLMHNIGPQRVQNSFTARFDDLNQDGHVDLLVGLRKPDAGFRVEWGDGHGHWSTQQGPGTAIETRAAVIDDLEHDGLMDILIGGEGDQQGLQIWHLDRDGLWKNHIPPTESGQYRDVAFADINEDGWTDVIGVQVASEEDGGVYAWLNDGRGGLVQHIGPLANGVFTGLVVADMNGDGHVDIVASRRGGTGAVHKTDTWRGSWVAVGGVEIWYGDGAGRWEPENLPAASDVEAVTVADVNGDGRLDIVAGLYLRGIELWLGSKNGWVKRTVVNDGTWGAVRVGDLDADGKRELVAASKDGRGLGLWKWNGGFLLSGDAFTPLTGWLPDSGTYYSLDLGDVHGRGLLDVAALRTDGAVQVWSFETAEQEPAAEFVGAPMGEPFKMYFGTALANVGEDEAKALSEWFKSLGVASKNYYFRVVGKADSRSVHSEVFPNNEALSLARAEALSAILRDQGVAAERIAVKALGDKEPVPEGMTDAAFQQNRTAWVQAYPLRAVRLPQSKGKHVERDMYNIEENTAFKTINGTAEYRVGPGDEVSITMWQGGKGDEHKVIVGVDGTISLPFFEGLNINDMTPTEIDAYMEKTLKRYVRHPRVDVDVLKYNSKTATIFGQIMDLTRQPTGPGTYPLQGKETLVDFISRTGGPTEKADMTQVQIIRNGKVVKLNLERAIQQADWRENAIMDDGDTVFVPSLEQAGRRVYVLGEVKTPGIVEFTGDFRILDAVSKTGGFTDNVYYQDIRVIRADRDKPLILPVAFNLLLEEGDLTQNLALNDRDIIIVPRSPIGNWNKFITDISPSVNLLLFQPMSAVSATQAIRLANKSLNASTTTTFIGGP